EERRGVVAVSDADAGTDVDPISAVATGVEGAYLINGSKMWITNGRYGNTFALAAKSAPKPAPPHKGISAFIVEKGAKDDTAFKVVRDIDKLGYRGVETCELYFDN